MGDETHDPGVSEKSPRPMTGLMRSESAEVAGAERFLDRNPPPPPEAQFATGASRERVVDRLDRRKDAHKQLKAGKVY